jgi:two-component system, OmpR family, response regulator
VAGTVAIIIVKDDFTIPGSPPGMAANNGGTADPESQFFSLLSERNPDVVVLDFSRQHARGVDVIAKIRARSSTPILVVTPADGDGAADFRAAGAEDCIKAPVDILAFSRALHRIIGKRKQNSTHPVAPGPPAVAFGGIFLQEFGSCLAGPNGNGAKLTTSESRVLSHLLSKPLTVCSRGEISEVLYGRHQPNSERAIDIIINRLRKKLMIVAGPDGQNLIKTEFRRGYMLAAELVESRGQVGDAAVERSRVMISGAV